MDAAGSEPVPEPGLALVLASRSPQRREILERLGVPFEVRPSDAQELERGEPRGLALENALRAAAGRREAVCACDAVLPRGPPVSGKPADAEQARAPLSALSGATHEVIS